MYILDFMFQAKHTIINREACPAQGHKGHMHLIKNIGGIYMPLIYFRYNKDIWPFLLPVIPQGQKL